jgi:hypothetical protein
VIKYWAQFNAHAVERVLAEHHDCVIDFGAGHSIYEDEIDFQRVQCALAPYAHVILLLPSQDLDESVAILSESIVEHHVKHRSNPDLAKMVVYTKDRTPEETCDEIVSRLPL